LLLHALNRRACLAATQHIHKFKLPVLVFTFRLRNNRNG
jgi:hypothetical protein